MHKAVRKSLHLKLLQLLFSVTFSIFQTACKYAYSDKYHILFVNSVCKYVLLQLIMKRTRRHGACWQLNCESNG